MHKSVQGDWPHSQASCPPRHVALGSWSLLWAQHPRQMLLLRSLPSPDDPQPGHLKPPQLFHSAVHVRS